MAVVAVTPKWSDRGSTRNADGSRTAYRSYQVLTDSADTDEVTVRQADGIPRAGSVHPKDALMFAGAAEARPAGPLLWDVTITYQSPPATDPEHENPLDQPPEVWTTSESYSETIDTDAQGKPIANSAGEPFDPPLTETVEIEILHVRKNLPSFDLGKAIRYRGGVNTDTFMGFEPGTCVLRTIDSRRIYSGGWTYESVYAEVAINTRLDPQGNLLGWKRRILDRGMRQRKLDANGDPAVDVNGCPAYEEAQSATSGRALSLPRNLDGNGRFLAEGADPVWIVVDTKTKKITLNDLNLT